MRRLSFVVLAIMLASQAGCPDNPYKAKTWTKKLNDPREAERAVTQLEQLGDPSAIEALGQAWIDQGKPVRLLQVIISLARPLTPEQAKATYMTDFESSGRPANWDKALPFLTKALTEVDEANPRSVDSAQKAADALGEAKIDGGLDPLIDIASKPVTKKLIAAEVSAIRAIGKYDTDKPKASAALVKIIDRDPPDHPRTAKDKEQARALEEKYGLFLGVTGASINALADLRVPSAVKTLVLSMYRTPELFAQVRRALVASGPTAEAELRKILRGEHAEVNQLFKDKRLDQYCGDKGDSKDCLPVSAKDFYAAVVLGDFYDPAAVPDLLAALDRPMLPQYYSDDQPSSSTNYNAIFDALKKIGAPTGADKLRAMWAGGPAPAAAKGRGKRGAPAAAPAEGGDKLMIRILAVGAYPFVARDDSGVPELGKIAADNNADQNLRTEAATAFARLSHDPADIKLLNELAQKYYDASDKKRKEADSKKGEKAAADKDFDAAKKKVEDAKSDALKTTHDPSKTAQDIKDATERAKKAEEDFKVAKKKHRDATAPFNNADGAAKDYINYAHMFQIHIARVEVAIRCKQDLNCYVGTLKETPDQAVKFVTNYIKGVDSWSKDDKAGLLDGEVERAMLEVGKQGPKAASFTDALLDAAKTDDRLMRQSILLALPKIAKVPCTNCEQKLDAAVKAGAGKSTLGDLNNETTMVRNYFAWAGGKTPTVKTDVPDAPVPTAEEPKKK
ncbi:MAG: hypothetical protein ABI467_11885 [Kofleriaceae bacterium]